MILTGKAKKHFLAHYGTGENYFLTTINEIEQHANIIEWLDSVGIFIDIDINISGDAAMFSHFMAYGEYFGSTEQYWKTRSEATKDAIKKANEIYNKR